MTMTQVTIVAADPSLPRVRQLQAALGAGVAGSSPGIGSIMLWAAPWVRTGPLPAMGAVHVMDLHGAIAACPGRGAAAQMRWCRKVLHLCRGAALLLVGSQAEFGFWSALLGESGVTAPLAIVPYAPADVARRTVGKARTLCISCSLDNPTLRPILAAAADWAGTAGLAVEIWAAGAVDRLVSVTLLPSGTAVSAGLPSKGATVLLDLRDDTPAERAATPSSVIEALAAGVPVLSTVNGALGAAMEAAGAGRVLTDGFVPLTGDAKAHADAAAAFAGEHFAVAAAASALHAAIGRATAAAALHHAAWMGGGRQPPQPLGPDAHVLVLSAESSNLAAVRVHLPFGALHARGAIAGYAVLHENEIVFDTHPGVPGRTFDAIWVHRSMEPEHRFLLDLLGRPFAYDIDDNLLATPSYRESFPGVARRTMQDLLQSAASVSCATRRLAGLLGARATVRLADKMVITPNLAQERPMARKAGPPRALIWASSDRPALTASQGAVVRAVRDHCLAHGVRLVCVGAAPPDALLGSEVEVESIGLLPHEEYQALLRSLSPSILVCPLESGADPETQGFVDGKSDIKIIEALSLGLVGVFSRAPPYQDTDIPGQILCDNTYEGWLDGLASAQAACLVAPPPFEWPAGRDSGGPGLAPWATALAAARLDNPVGIEELRWAIAEVELRYAPLITQEEFDEEFYLGSHDDVRLAVGAGIMVSGFDHYATAGQAEHRRARKRRRIHTPTDIWWDDLLHELTRIEAVTAARTDRIDALQRRLALRRSLSVRPS